MAVYPNPAMNHLYVNLGKPSGEFREIERSWIFQERLLKTVDVQPGISLYQLDVAHLSAGMYMVYWMEGEEIEGRKKVVLPRRSGFCLKGLPQTSVPEC